MDDALAEYRQLVAKVDQFASRVTNIRRDAIQCGPGCDGCCQDGLTVSPVEAQSIRDYLDSRPEQAAELRGATKVVDRCRMLRSNGRCGVYEARPLVCRTQGLPLRYPRNFVPARTLQRPLGVDRGKRETVQESDVMWCPLNFAGTRPPAEDEIIDAERVDATLAVVNQRFCARNATDPLKRVPIHNLL